MSQRLLRAIGIVLLLGWTLWWGVSISRDTLVNARKTWIPAADNLGLDFKSNYLAARHWILKGGNPYLDSYGDPAGHYCYAPVVLPLFSWCVLVGPRTALGIWLAAIVAIMSVGAWWCQRARTALGSAPLPLTFVLAGVLLSTPVTFAMERANCDVIVVAMILAAAWLVRRDEIVYEALAGLCLALATWSKVYPALLVAAFVPMGRWRVASFAVIFGLLMGLIPITGTLQWIHNARTYLHRLGPTPVGHALSSVWPDIWQGTELEELSRIPGVIGAGLILMPLAAWVTLRVRGRVRPRDTFKHWRIALPYLLWLAAVGSFWTPGAYDYKLLFLPLAAMAVWDRRDPYWVHMLMSPLLLWWQPMQLSIGGWPLLAFKLAGLIAIGVSLTIRAHEIHQRDDDDEDDEEDDDEADRA